MEELLRFLLNNFFRSLAVMGYSFFGLIVATQDIQLCLSAAAIAGGSYFFTEFIRYFKINPNDVMNKTRGKNKFHFLLFP
jgi:hypothetical protein